MTGEISIAYSSRHIAARWPKRDAMPLLHAQVRVIVSGTGDWRYVDCVSSHGGKLQALERVRTLFSVPKERCVAAGDSGNDILMLEGELLSGNTSSPRMCSTPNNVSLWL